VGDPAGRFEHQPPSCHRDRLFHGRRIHVVEQGDVGEADIEDFLELRDNTGDHARRTHNLNIANWIPDLFMERVEKDWQWSLFDPKVVPHLTDLYGAEFERAYLAALAADHGDKPALFFKGATVSYARLEAESDAFGAKKASGKSPKSSEKAGRSACRRLRRA